MKWLVLAVRTCIAVPSPYCLHWGSVWRFSAKTCSALRRTHFLRVCVWLLSQSLQTRVTDHCFFTPAKLDNLSDLSVQWLTWPSSSADEIGTFAKVKHTTGTICIIFLNTLNGLVVLSVCYGFYGWYVWSGTIILFLFYNIINIYIVYSLYFTFGLFDAAMEAMALAQTMMIIRRLSRWSSDGTGRWRSTACTGIFILYYDVCMYVMYLVGVDFRDHFEIANCETDWQYWQPHFGRT